jgi:general secretion pathway protein I
MRRIAPGFTLLEVLLALAVVAVTLAALVAVVGRSVNLQEHLRDRFFANLVASNTLTAVLLEPNLPAIGERSGDAQMGRKSWHWRAMISATQETEIRRIDVDVYLPNEANPLLRLSGFRSRVAHR